MSNAYGNFGVANTPIGTSSEGYGPFGVVNSTLSGLSTIPNIVTDSVSPTAFNSGVLSGNINSANFVHGSAGWSINADGSAEFQNVIGLSFTGVTINGSTITGGVIRTAASGQRVLMSGANNDVEFYDTGGNIVGSLVAGAASNMLIFAGTPPAFNGYDFRQAYFAPNPAISDLGTTSLPWGNVYALTYHTTPLVFWSSGSGSPQGVVAASPGSLYTNTDGGANVTLYVKESGTGNVGWAAK